MRFHAVKALAQQYGCILEREQWTSEGVRYQYVLACNREGWEAPCRNLYEVVSTIKAQFS